MRFVPAYAAFGFFSWFSYMVYSNAFFSVDAPSISTLLFKDIVIAMTNAIGVNATALGLFLAGAAIAFVLIFRQWD